MQLGIYELIKSLPGRWSRLRQAEPRSVAAQWRKVNVFNILFVKTLPKTKSSTRSIDDELMPSTDFAFHIISVLLCCQMMRDIVSGSNRSGAGCRQQNNFTFAHCRSIDKVFFTIFSLVQFLLRALCCYKCMRYARETSVCEISNDYVHFSFYAQLNLDKFYERRNWIHTDTRHRHSTDEQSVWHRPSEERWVWLRHNFHIYFELPSCEWAQQNCNKINEFYGKTSASQLWYYYYWLDGWMVGWLVYSYEHERGAESRPPVKDVCV